MSSETPLVTGLRVLDEGVTVVNPATAMDFVGTAVAATNPSPGKAQITVTSGSTGTQVVGEHPTDNGDGTYTLAFTPTAGTLIVYRNGVRLNVGAGNDYTLSGAIVTLLSTYNASDVITVDYQH